MNGHQRTEWVILEVTVRGAGGVAQERLARAVDLHRGQKAVSTAHQPRVRRVYELGQALQLLNISWH